MPKKTFNVKTGRVSKEGKKVAVVGELLKVEKGAREYAEEIIATVREPLVVLDMNLKVMLVNRSFYQVFKVSPKETVGRFIYNLGNKQWDIPKLRQLLEEVLPKKTNFENYEVEHKFETIGQKTMLLNARRIPRPPQKPKIILLAIEDITERKKMEQQLDEVILASIGDAVMACDRTGKVILFNATAEELTGFSAKEVIGRHYSQHLKFTIEGDGKPDKDFIAQAMDEGKIIVMANKTMIIRKDGTKMPIAESAAPLKGHKGQIIGCVVVLRDVTKEKAVANLKDEFLSVAAHALRTPMTAIKGFLDMIIKGQVGKLPTTKMKEYLLLAYEGNERMIKLVNDLLNVSRIEAGRMKFDLANIQIEKVIEQSITELEKISHSKGLYLKFEKPEKSLPKIIAAEDKVQMVLTNIIGNAIKYTEKGGVKITAEADKKLVTVHIQDTGIGIAKEDQDKLFKKFSQIGKTISSSQKGTGLGLYTSKVIVEKLGGKIWCESKGEGKGSIFSFSLPIKGSSASHKAIIGIQREARAHPDQK